MNITTSVDDDGAASVADENDVVILSSRILSGFLLLLRRLVPCKVLAMRSFLRRRLGRRLAVSSMLAGLEDTLDLRLWFPGDLDVLRLGFHRPVQSILAARSSISICTKTNKPDCVGAYDSFTLMTTFTQGSSSSSSLTVRSESCLMPITTLELVILWYAGVLTKLAQLLVEILSLIHIVEDPSFTV